MKISMFHLMPYRDLPDDFEKRYHSVWVDPPFQELTTPEKAGMYYNWTLDELIYAAKAGMDGVCVNEHHQNAYGNMPGPNLMGSVLARATAGMDVGDRADGRDAARRRSRRSASPKSTPCSTASAAAASSPACRSAARWTPTSATASRRSSSASATTRRTT